MKTKEKAMTILDNLDKVITVDWNFREFYLKAIEQGLMEIQKQEKLEKV